MRDRQSVSELHVLLGEEKRMMRRMEAPPHCCTRNRVEEWGGGGEGWSLSGERPVGRVE